MFIYSGIQLVFAHVQQFISSISSWYSQIEWNVLLEQLPISYISFVSACLMILLAMSAVGLVKKLSFLLG